MMANREMKNSGVPWLKDIPSEWKVERGKNVLVLQKRPVRDDDEVVTCFRDGEVILRSLRRTEGFTMSDKEIGYQGINEGDIVIHGMDGFAGAMGVSKSTGKGSPVLVVCSPKYDAIPQYIIYYLRALAMTDVFIALATGIRERSCDLRWNKISELEFILPSAKEQQKIASFLDRKCSEIDEMIALQEKIVEELKVYKQSVITEAVTKGLNPDVPMKDSGIEWIGEIPEHWKTIRIKYLLGERKERSIHGEEEPLSMSQKYGLIPTKEMDVIPNMASSFEGAKIVYPEDLVFNKLKAHLGVFSTSKYNGLVSPDYAVYFGLGRALMPFMEFMFKTPQYISEFRKTATGVGSGLTRLYTSDLFSMLFPLPSIDEQREIVNYLEEKRRQIDSLINIKLSKIDSLKEYKKSIIYEYVTGKKEVTE